MSGASVMAALLSLGVGFPVGADAYADADNSVTATAEPSSSAEQQQETTTASFSVEKVDRSNRSLVVQGPGGSRMTVKVAPTVEGFEQLQKGDQVELDYYMSSVVSLAPADAPAAQEQEAPTRANAPALGAAADTQLITTAARVTAVDNDKGALQIVTPDKRPQTLLVQDRAERRRLRSLSPGDRVEVTYAEPVAVGLRTSTGR